MATSLQYLEKKEDSYELNAIKNRKFTLQPALCILISTFSYQLSQLRYIQAMVHFDSVE